MTARAVAEATMTVTAIYKNGVFRPTVPVNLPENIQVEVVLPSVPGDSTDMEAIYRIMGELYSSGEPNVAEQHNEHQPCVTDKA